MSEGRNPKIGKNSPLEKLREVIDAAVSEVLEGLTEPGIRDEEMIRDAVKMRTIRRRLKRVAKEIRELTPQEVKDLEKEKKLLKDELAELSVSLETKVAGDAQIRIDEDDEEEDSELTENRGGNGGREG